MFVKYFKYGKMRVLLMNNFVLRHTKISFLLYMLTTAVASFIIQSAMATIHYPTNGRFVLVTDLEKINDNGLYLLMAIENDEGRLLTNTLVKGKTKLGTTVVTSITDTIKSAPLSSVWQIKGDGNNKKLLISYQNDLIVGKSSKSVTDVSLNADVEASNVVHFSLKQQGQFILFQSDDRCLSYNCGYKHAGYYLLDGMGYSNFMLYEYQCDTVEIRDHDSSVPDAFVFIYKGKAVQFAGDGQWQSMDVSPYRLFDGTYASDVPATIVHTEGHSLYNQDNELVHHSSDGDWICCNEYLFQNNSDSISTLCHNEADNKLLMMNVGRVDGLKFTLVPIAPIAALPVSDVKNRHLILSGGWSVSKLESIDIGDSISVIDITKAILPLALPKINVDDSNTLILVNESDTSRVSREQTNVLSLSGGQRTLIRPLRLVDRKPFYIDGPFSVGENVTVDYSRVMPDNGWQTFYLPFSTDNIPESIELAAIDHIADDKIYLRYTESIKAHTPVLLKYSGAEGETITFQGKNQTIEPAAVSVNLLVGTYERKNIGGNDIYCLDDKGTSFVRVRPGSYIDAFRAYLSLGNANVQRLQFATSGISITAKNDERGTKVYSLDGKRVLTGEMSLDAQTKKLVPGLYIVNGKIIKKK